MMRNSWLPHVVCVAILALSLAMGSLSHRTGDELLAVAYDTQASAGQRVTAMRTLSTRPDATQAEAESLWDEAMASADPDVRMLAAGSDLLRFGAGARRGTPPTPPAAAESYLATLTDPDASQWLWFILYRRKVGGMQVGSRRRLDLREAAWTIQALAGQAPPNNEAKAHVLKRAQNGMRRPR